MGDVRSKPEDSIDIRLLARQELTHEAFPGGRNQGFRVFFTPEVHAALWNHASLDTSVEICGVLVGSWHRDQTGPFVKIVESIRGEGAETKFAEVTFTHQTWAKINSEMDTKFAKWSIVGWYHTHPDFGIFLSDRDRFIQEHFFSGPGQIAHVIDPIRGIEGVFAWRSGKPTLCDHFWVGDRIHFGPSANSELAGDRGKNVAGPQARDGPPGGDRAPQQGSGSRGGLSDLRPRPGRLMIYGCVFLMGWLLSALASAWERQRFVESVLASNGPFSILRLGLSDELDRLRGDLAAMVRPIKAIKAGTGKSDDSLAEIQQQLEKAAERTAIIKARYGYTTSEERLLSQMLVDQLRRAARSAPADLAPLPELPRTEGLSSSGTGSTVPSEPAASTPPEAAKDKTDAKDTKTAKP